jgi:hypothetical protein
MDPVTMAAVGQAAAPIIGGLMGSMLGSDDREAAAANMAKAVQALQDVGLPPDLSHAIILEKFKSAGVLTPQLEQDLGHVTSKFAEFKEDQNLKNVQTDALSALSQRAKTGLSAEDQSNLNQIRTKALSDAEGQKQAVVQQMAARGMGGSGNELVAQLAAGQNAANQEASQGLNIAAQAQRAALDAIQQRASMASAMRGQDLQTAQATGNAADIMAKFNQENSMGRQTRNVGTQNQAQQYNLTQAQNIGNMNTDANNKELYRQAGASRDFWNDKLTQAKSVAGALTGQADSLNESSDRKAKQGAGVGAGVGQMIGAFNQ